VRLWSIHPKYLDVKGLVALWRETLLAQAVLAGQTRGYRNHPQLDRFKAHSAPLPAMSSYLTEIHGEAVTRGYSFDQTKIGPVKPVSTIEVTTGQRDLEWQHLLAKLEVRSPDLFQTWRRMKTPECHPLFTLIPGPVADWERAEEPKSKRSASVRTAASSTRKKPASGS